MEAWFRTFYPGYKLRHIIPRSTLSGPRGSSNHSCTVRLPPSSVRRSFPLQSPVLRFHVDSDHTDFVNLWVPFTNTSYPLGFLYDHHLGEYVTGEMASKLFASPSVRSEAPNRYAVLYRFLPPQTCVLFQSGGRLGLVHGSVGVPGREEGERESVEFRGQRYDEGRGGWEYGTEDRAKPPPPPPPKPPEKKLVP